MEEAVRALLGAHKKPPWDPRRELLVHRRPVSFQRGEKDIARLLQLWQKTAEARGQADVAAALGIQIAASSHLEEGDVMLDAFRAIAPPLDTVREALFASFRTWVVNETLETWGRPERVPCGDWVGALVDAARTGHEGASAFHAAVRAALKEGHAAPVAPVPVGPRMWQRTGTRFALAVLTCDLDATAPMLRGTAPRLAKLLSAEVGRERRRLDATRRAWAKRLDGPSLLPEVLAFWRDAAVRFVPDPGAQSTDYEASADWLAAVRELNPEAAEVRMARWADVHRRRRNLWRDLAARGLSLPGEVRAAPAQAGRRGR